VQYQGRTFGVIASRMGCFVGDQEAGDHRPAHWHCPWRICQRVGKRCSGIGYSCHAIIMMQDSTGRGLPWNDRAADAQFCVGGPRGLVDGPSEHRLIETCGKVVACGRFGGPSWGCCSPGQPLRANDAPALHRGFGRCPWRFSPLSTPVRPHSRGRRPADTITAAGRRIIKPAGKGSKCVTGVR
jgi:hypothetical protein